jgi:methanogenic corrinoid protein MtbC1
LVDALAELKLDAAERILAQASNDYSPRDLVMHVVAPTLREVGQRWESGELCTASEHAASALMRTRLGALLAAQPPGTGSAVVCTTPAGELHELGALLVAVLTAMHGRRVVYLGANLPAGEIAEAVKMSRAKAVAISVIGMTAGAASKELKRIAALLPPKVELVVGGGGAKPRLLLPTNARNLGTLEELERWLDRGARG